MMIAPPIAAAQAGTASGGGLIDSFQNAVAGATGGAGTPGAPAQVQPGPKGDGSVGLFDGVGKKALFGGAAGAVLGFLPFIPGGPILGGVLGAVGGAAMGVFTNWMKMKQIKQENQAMLSAMGVQAPDPQVAQILQSGNVAELVPLSQQQAAGTPQQGVPQQGVQQQGVPTQAVPVSAAQQAQAVAQGQLPAVVDPSAAPQQSPVPTQATGRVAVGSGGTGAINPSLAVDPGIAPALAGGGSAGDAGRPPAPVGTESSDVSAIAPAQAGVVPQGATAAAATGAATIGPAATAAATTTVPTDPAQIEARIAELQAQIDQLKELLARADQADAAARAIQTQAA